MNLLGEILYGRIDRKPFALRVSVMEMIIGYSSTFIPQLLQNSYGSLDAAPALLKNIFGIAILIIFFFEMVLCVKRGRDIGIPAWIGAFGLLASSLMLGMAGKTTFLVAMMLVPPDFWRNRKKR